MIALTPTKGRSGLTTSLPAATMRHLLKQLEYYTGGGDCRSRNFPTLGLVLAKVVSYRVGQSPRPDASVQNAVATCKTAPIGGCLHCHNENGGGTQIQCPPIYP